MNGRNPSCLAPDGWAGVSQRGSGGPCRADDGDGDGDGAPLDEPAVGDNSKQIVPLRSGTAFLQVP